uniref:Uncharacterized protein n=1 Tax=Chlamydomonas euryale TaxID=1486919 RepID=A0A7R9V8P9_9CHLO
MLLLLLLLLLILLPLLLPLLLLLALLRLSLPLVLLPAVLVVHSVLVCRVASPSAAIEILRREAARADGQQDTRVSRGGGEEPPRVPLPLGTAPRARLAASASGLLPWGQTRPREERRAVRARGNGALSEQSLLKAARASLQGPLPQRRSAAWQMPPPALYAWARREGEEEGGLRARAVGAL